MAAVFEVIKAESGTFVEDCQVELDGGEVILSTGAL